MKWYENNECPVPVIQADVEFNALLALYRSLNAKTVLEIGSLHGGTLWHWIRYAAPYALIMSFDRLVVPQDSRYEQQKAGHDGIWQSWADNGKHVSVFNTFSQGSVALEIANTIAPFDFIFVDGDHTYNGVKRDFELYWPMVAKGGVMAFHDIYRRTQIDEVWRLWDEIKLSGIATHELHSVADQTDLGIGVIIKND